MTPTPADQPTAAALEAALRLAIGALQPNRGATGTAANRHTSIEFLPPEYRAAADLLGAHLPALSRAPALVEAIRTALAELDSVPLALLGGVGLADAGDTLESALAALDAGEAEGE